MRGTSLSAAPCSAGRSEKRLSEHRKREGRRQLVLPVWSGVVPLDYDADAETGKPEAGWSPCLEDERYISAILLSALIFAEVIAFILFSACCWQCCMVY